MGILSLFRRNKTTETRATGTGFTAQVIDARHAHIIGGGAVAETTAAAQSCVSLWEGGLSLAAVDGTDLLTPSMLAMTARSLALRGEALFLIDGDRLVVASDWDLSTRSGVPTAYRLTLPEAGGSRSVTALAAEVLHLRIGSTATAPWAGSPPLHRASLSAGMLNAVESALAEVFELAPLGSQIAPMPESPEIDNERLARSFRGQRGRVLLRESVAVTAAGGPTPVTDWKPSSLSPDLERSQSTQTLAAARDAVCSVFGVLPSLLNTASTGPVIREAQRHLAMWQLQPMAGMIAAEASDKLGSPVTLDTLEPLQAYDAGGRARALKGAVDALAAAKAAGLSDEAIAAVARFSGVPSE